MFSKIGFAAAALLAISAASAQSPAPVPAQILSARKVFVSNAGGEVNNNPPRLGQQEYTGGPDRAYHDFYSALRRNSKFEIAATPSEADLVLEIRFVDTLVANADAIAGDPQIRFVVRDPKTGMALWGITEHIAVARRARNREKNFDEALRDIVNRLLALRAGA